MKLSGSRFWPRCLPVLGLLAVLAACASAALQPVSTPATAVATSAEAQVFIVPLDGALTGNTVSTFRAALAAAPVNAVVMVDLRTHGGDMGSAVAIARLLAEHRATAAVTIYVRAAEGPGALLLATADRIYASPAAPIDGGTADSSVALPLSGNELDKLCAPVPYRSEIIRALFDGNYSFAVGNTTIKAYGQPLSLTGESAARQLGDPPQPLLVNAVTPSFDLALHTGFPSQPATAQIWTADGFVPRAVDATPVANTPPPPAAPALAPAAVNPPAAAAPSADKARVAVYVVPIEGEIDTPQLYILRRALKSAIENHVDAVVLDMNTPGGSVAVTLDMMDALSKFKGRSFTYVNPNALSAGSYIAVATNEIYFAPDGVMGAAAVVGGSGEDISDTMRLKINSYLIARVHALAGPSRYRADVQRAMMDEKFEFKIGDKVIKPVGELLSLTAKDACQTYGDPPEPLLGAGIAANLDDLLTQVYGKDGYTIKDFHITWSEHLAKWLNSISALLLGAGLLLLFIEFKASSFGFLGFLGIALLLLVFVSGYISGLAGYEPFILFLLGLVLIALELFVFTASFACGILGALCFFASFVWAMTDVWPSEQDFGVTPEAVAQPILNVVLGFTLAIVGFALVLRYLPKTRAYGFLVNESSVPRPDVAASGGGAAATGAVDLPEPGTRGLAITDLRPLGEIDIAGGRYQARAAQGQIDRGAAVEVVSRQDFALKVKKADPA